MSTKSFGKISRYYKAVFANKFKIILIVPENKNMSKNTACYLSYFILSCLLHTLAANTSQENSIYSDPIFFCENHNQSSESEGLL